MAVYTNIRPNSPITAVEFSPVSEGNLSFFHVKDATAKETVKQWLASQGQTILAQTESDTETILVTNGVKSQKELNDALAARGDTLELSTPKKGFQPWKIRGQMSIVGQPLQLVSAYLQKGGIDGATAGFAISNLIANAINVAFGAEKSKDPHHLRMLKEEFNRKLSHYLPQGAELPDPNEDHASLRHGPAAKKTMGQKTHDFIAKNSVRFGEIGLRYLGAFILAFPIKNWKGAANSFQTTAAPGGNFSLSALPSAVKAAFVKGSESDPKFRTSSGGVNKFNFYAGMAYIVGKTIALLSKVPDPYNPNRHSNWVTKAREQVVFRAASVIEAGAAFTIAYDRFENRKIILPHTMKLDADSMPIRGTVNPDAKAFHKVASKLLPEDWQGRKTIDFIGGIGGTLFAIAQGIRFFAKFGVKEVNMEELSAHITDGLAKLPSDKLPQFLADTVADMKEHFKGKDIEFGKLYTQMATDLYRYHNLALPGGMRSPPSATIDAQNLSPDEVGGRKFTDGFTPPPASQAQRVNASREQQAAASIA